MESAFQFSNPSLVDLEFELNQDFESSKGHEVQIKMGMSVQVMDYSNKNETVVSLQCEVGERAKTVPFYIKVTEKANFRWRDELSKETVDKLLQQNAPALLLSYLRPIVAQITEATSYGAFHIPFINFTEKNND